MEPAPDLDEAADHRADLAVQEAARGERELDPVAKAGDIETVERFLRARRLAARVPERREVVVAEQQLRSLMHRARVKLCRHAPGEAALQRKVGAAVDDRHSGSGATQR
jgi:hypothetical protein